MRLLEGAILGFALLATDLYYPNAYPNALTSLFACGKDQNFGVGVVCSNILMMLDTGCQKGIDRGDDKERKKGAEQETADDDPADLLP